MGRTQRRVLLEIYAKCVAGQDHLWRDMLGDEDSGQQAIAPVSPIGTRLVRDHGHSLAVSGIRWHTPETRMTRVSAGH